MSGPKIHIELSVISQTILPMYCIIKKKKKKIIKNQFELNSEKCIKMRMSGPKIHIQLSVISR